MSPFALTLVSLISSGDVDAAETYRGGWCSGRAWTRIESAHIRGACSRWGVDPTRFGAAPAPVCPPDLWPVRASFVAGEVPLYPTDEDFQTAVMAATNHYPEPAYVWRMEAIRWRRGPGYGQPLDLPAIESATVAAMARLAAKNAARS